MRHRYHISLFWSDEDDYWIAVVPDLTYCSAHGPTLEPHWQRLRPRCGVARRSGRGRTARSGVPALRPAQLMGRVTWRDPNWKLACSQDVPFVQKIAP